MVCMPGLALDVRQGGKLSQISISYIALDGGPPSLDDGGRGVDRDDSRAWASRPPWHGWWRQPDVGVHGGGRAWVSTAAAAAVRFGEVVRVGKKKEVSRL